MHGQTTPEETVRMKVGPKYVKEQRLSREKQHLYAQGYANKQNLYRREKKRILMEHNDLTGARLHVHHKARLDSLDTGEPNGDSAIKPRILHHQENPCQLLV